MNTSLRQSSLRGRLGSARGLALASMIGFGAATPAAAEPRWVPIGPPGGEVASAVVAANGRTVFASGGASVFKSANGGRTWSASGSGVIGGVSELAAGDTR